MCPFPSCAVFTHQHLTVSRESRTLMNLGGCLTIGFSMFPPATHHVQTVAGWNAPAFDEFPTTELHAPLVVSYATPCLFQEKEILLYRQTLREILGSRVSRLHHFIGSLSVDGYPKSSQRRITTNSPRHGLGPR